MILCDIGNSSAKFYDNGIVTSVGIEEFKNFNPNKKIFYINVNPNVKIENENFIDLEPYFEYKNSYKGLGIDRIAACESVENGVIVDAGSAITVDLKYKNDHLGGFILPGISAYLSAYRQISSRLDVNLNSGIDIDAIPQTTDTAVNFGIFKSIILMIKDIAKDSNIYFTGGDGRYFQRYFKNSIYDRDLIFRSMLKIIKQKDLA